MVVYVALTFDDGYLKQYEVADTLSRKGIEATFFLITHLRGYDGEALLATKPELVRKMHKIGHEIASHTRTHPLLTEVAPEIVEEECSTSKSFLSELVGDEVRGFAYPYGVYNDKVINIVKKYYSYARIMGAFNRWNTESRDPYTIGGMGIRHLAELPFNLLPNHNTRYLVLVFHADPLRKIANTIRLLNLMRARFLTLKQLVEEMNVV